MKMNENQTKFYPKQAVACGLIPSPFRGGLGRGKGQNGNEIENEYERMKREREPYPNKIQPYMSRDLPVGCPSLFGYAQKEQIKK
jgi:hypothetical protein